jgi:hypothetical protein
MHARNVKVILFNLAAVLVTIAAVGAVVKSWLFSAETQPCTQRYPSAMIFALENGGRPLSPSDLQARLSGKDLGVVENVGIERIKDGPAGVAMSISLANQAAAPRATAAPHGGMSFPWEPRSMHNRVAACLAYHVRLPADFEFHNGGALPGIFGAEEALTGTDGFTAQLAWYEDGHVGVRERATKGGTTRVPVSENDNVTFPRDRWFKVEQEVVLNAPQGEDGIMRVWIDGHLAIDETAVVYRSKPEVTIAGVAAEVSNGSNDAGGAAAKDSRVWMTPLEIRWQ